MNEEELASVFAYMQKELAPDISIEVGAHSAEFSTIMAGYGIDAYAFEASPYVYGRYRNIQIPDLLWYLNTAISDEDGTAKFQIQERTDPAITGNNTIMNRLENTEYKYIDIPQRSLDSFFKPDGESEYCLWIDAEGATGKVLRGARKLLNYVSSIHIEVETREFWQDQWLLEDVEEYLAGYGFKEYKRCNIDIHGHQLNIIYTKHDIIDNPKEIL